MCYIYYRVHYRGLPLPLTPVMQLQNGGIWFGVVISTEAYVICCMRLFYQVPDCLTTGYLTACDTKAVSPSPPRTDVGRRSRQKWESWRRSRTMVILRLFSKATIESWPPERLDSGMITLKKSKHFELFRPPFSHECSKGRAAITLMGSVHRVMLLWFTEWVVC